MQISKQWVTAYEAIISPRNITMESYSNLKSYKRNRLVFSTSRLFKEFHLSMNNEYLIFSKWFEWWWISVTVLDNHATIPFPLLLSDCQRFVLPRSRPPLDLSNKASFQPMLSWNHDHPAGWGKTFSIGLVCPGWGGHSHYQSSGGKLIPRRGTRIRKVGIRGAEENNGFSLGFCFLGLTLSSQSVLKAAGRWQGLKWPWHKNLG